jgi:hypothetical protein
LGGTFFISNLERWKSKVKLLNERGDNEIRGKVWEKEFKIIKDQINKLRLKIEIMNVLIVVLHQLK